MRASTHDHLNLNGGVGRAKRSAGHGVVFAWAALVVGLAYALVSLYWGLGGTRLLATAGSGLVRLGRHNDPTAVLAVWGAVIVKLSAAVLPLYAARLRVQPARGRRVVALVWAEAVILTAYGLVLTGVGLLVQAGAIDVQANADRRALAWHAFLWDPWFLVWGLLVTCSLFEGRRLVSGRSSSTTNRSTGCRTAPAPMGLSKSDPWAPSARRAANSGGSTNRRRDMSNQVLSRPDSFIGTDERLSARR